MFDIVNKIITKIYEKPFVLIFVFSTVFFIVSAYLLPIRFEENDDIVMLGKIIKQTTKP